MSELNCSPRCGQRFDPLSSQGEGSPPACDAAVPGHGAGRSRSIRHTKEYAAIDMNSKLIINLRDLGRMLRSLYEGRESQQRILILLLEHGGMTQRELTQRLGIQPGSASEVIGKLEDAGLILRTESPSDRRTSDIQLTEPGFAQASEAAQRRKVRHEEMFSCLEDEEKQTLLALTEKLNADWDIHYREKEASRQHVHNRKCHF